MFAIEMQTWRAFATSKFGNEKMPADFFGFFRFGNSALFATRLQCGTLFMRPPIDSEGSVVLPRPLRVSDERNRLFENWRLQSHRTKAIEREPHETIEWKPSKPPYETIEWNPPKATAWNHRKLSNLMNTHKLFANILKKILSNVSLSRSSERFHCVSWPVLVSSAPLTS